MFNRKLKERIDELEARLKAEQWRSEVEGDTKHAYMQALSTALIKGVITFDQYNQINDFEHQYYSVLRNYKEGA